MAKQQIIVSDEQKGIINHLIQRHRDIFINKRWSDPAQLEQVLRATEQDLHVALNKWPDHPLMMFHAGVFYQHTERSGVCINLFKRAIQSGLQGPAIYLNMAGAYKNEHMDDLAEYYYLQGAAEASKPGRVESLVDDNRPEEEKMSDCLNHAYHGVGSLYINRGEPQKCIDWCDRALKINPNDRFALWNKGIACLEIGRWEEGGRLYHEAGFMTSEWKSPERKIKDYGGLPQWDGTPGQTIVCYGEQGVGDEVMFATMIPDLMKDCKVIIDCDPRLEALFKRSFPDAEAVYPTSEVDAPFPWKADHQIDARLAMGSLLHFYRKSEDAFPKVPYLKADPVKRERWRAELAKLGPGKHVAISYAGGLKKTRQDLRTIDPKMLVDMVKIPGIHWHSVQYHDFGPENAAVLGRLAGVPVHHWHDMIKDWNEWAGFLSEIDLLITVNTSVHHLAGSLGVPQWCLTPKYVAWRYGITGPSPFYGNCTMLRQNPVEMKWEPVIQRVNEKLTAWMEGGPLHDGVFHETVGLQPKLADVATGSGLRLSGHDPGTPVARRTTRKPSKAKHQRSRRAR